MKPLLLSEKFRPYNLVLVIQARQQTDKILHIALLTIVTENNKGSVTVALPMQLVGLWSKEGPIINGGTVHKIQKLASLVSNTMHA